METPSVESWIVPVKGHDFDMEDLPVYLENSPATVVKRENKYYLSISALVAGCTYERVLEIAGEYLSLINGAASLIIGNYRPMELEAGAYFGIDKSGAINNTVLPIGPAELRIKGHWATLSINGIPQADPRKGQLTSLITGAAAINSEADALHILGRRHPTWSELYLVFEIVESSVGGVMYSAGWLTKASAERFTRTANSYSAIGQAARHGKILWEAPADPMDLHSASELIRGLVKQWLTRKTTISSNDG